ncbi:MAG TPA: ATP cone domain-containing protein [Candidatus Acidoferrales bacterium]|nr:ATP cone domain-containing protein [Candidatus Acidoferrales bacterium]
MYVRKFDGSTQQFDKNRIIASCLRNGASQETAYTVADRIENESYDGMRTKEILDLVWQYLGEHHPDSRIRIDLRLALSLLKSKPDFEEYASLILKDLGYSVQSNVIVKGKCIEHEIDAIAQKDTRTLYVEVKHHDQAHTYTPLEVSMKVWATHQDLIAGRKLGYHNFDFTNALIICNTKFTDHARRFADCVGIDRIGWKSPPSNSLDGIIESRRLYPITILRGERRLQRLLLDNGIVLLRQLVDSKADRLTRDRILSTSQLSNLRQKSVRILSQLN